MRTTELYAGLLVTLSLAAATPAFPAAIAGEELSPAQRQQAMRLLEYESLLGSPLPAGSALCMDDLLASRWPRADQPSPQQWRHMLSQAREAQEQCAAPPAETSRAAKAIRQAMEKQVAHQRALETHLAQLRMCAALPASAPVPAPCQALRHPEVTPPAQWERIARAIKLGQQ
jgi:uncharacterized membrane protein